MNKRSPCERQISSAGHRGSISEAVFCRRLDKRRRRVYSVENLTNRCNRDIIAIEAFYNSIPAAVPPESLTGVRRSKGKQVRVLCDPVTVFGERGAECATGPETGWEGRFCAENHESGNLPQPNAGQDGLPSCPWPRGDGHAVIAAAMRLFDAAFFVEKGAFFV